MDTFVSSQRLLGICFAISMYGTRNQTIGLDDGSFQLTLHIMSSYDHTALRWHRKESHVPLGHGG